MVINVAKYTFQFIKVIEVYILLVNIVTNIQYTIPYDVAFQVDIPFNSIPWIYKT